MRARAGCLVFLTALLTLHCALAQDGHNISTDIYIKKMHHQVFDQFSLLVYGTLSLARSAVQGAVAVTGTAKLEEFDIGRVLPCNVSLPTLSVLGRLSARLGAINSGPVLAAPGSTINHSVLRGCSTLVREYIAHRRGAVPFKELGDSLVRDLGDNCVMEKSGDVKTVNSTMFFEPRPAKYSCYSVFDVMADDLRLIRDWNFAGNDSNRNVVINVIGKRAIVKDFKMVKFNAQRTLINFCSTYGSFQFFNSRIHGSVLAPSTYFTMMDVIVNGSMVTSSLTGQLVVTKQIYKPC